MSDRVSALLHIIGSPVRILGIVLMLIFTVEVVIDTGDGIREDMLDKLFVPFSTSKPTGVGLGLGICRRIANSHGGSLTGQNRLEGGAVFILSLPLYVSESNVSESNVSEASEAKESLNREALCKAC